MLLVSIQERGRWQLVTAHALGNDGYGFDVCIGTSSERDSIGRWRRGKGSLRLFCGLLRSSDGRLGPQRQKVVFAGIASEAKCGIGEVRFVFEGVLWRGCLGKHF